MQLQSFKVTLQIDDLRTIKAEVRTQIRRHARIERRLVIGQHG